MKRNIFKSLLAIACLSGSVNASAYDFEVDGIYYNVVLLNEQTCEVTKEASDKYYEGDIVIPATVDYANKTLTVVGVESEAFRNCSNLTGITISNTITSIGNYAFNGCTKLENVTIVDGESTLELGYNYYYDGNPSVIGRGLFYDCPIKTLYIGRNLSYETSSRYGYSPFDNIEKIKDVTIGNSVTEIGERAFSDCSGLESVTIGNSVTEIGERAFWRCSGLESVTIPNSVTSIGSSAFYGCSNLEHVTIEDGETTLDLGYNSYNNSYTGEGLFYDCPIKTLYLGRNLSYETGKDYGYSPFYNKRTLIDLTIGNSVTLIGNYAFEGCSGFESVTIPNSVTSIGSSAFSGCSGLKSVTIGNSVTSIGSSAFSGCSGLKSVTIPSSVTTIGGEAFRYCSALTVVYISDLEAWFNIDFLSSPNTDTSNPLEYAHHLYLNGEEIKDLVIPTSVTEIKLGTFYGCIGLTSVTIPNSVTSIGRYAFDGCSGLKKVIVKDIAAWCGISFYSSDSNPLYYTHHLYSDEETEIKDLVIPNSVTSIGSSAFYNCSGLTSITLPNSVTSIGSSAFYNCSGFTSITLPNSVTSIGSSAFSGCSGFESVTIPNSITKIGNSAFYGCSKLENVKIEDGETTLDLDSGRGLFYDCPIKTLYLGRTLSYAASAMSSPFNSKAKLTDLTIGNSVTKINDYAFEYCSGLTSVTIPNSVTRIGNYAFSDCTGLASVTIGNSVTSIGSSLFLRCSKLATLYSLNTTPPSVVSDNFDYKDYMTLNVFVPETALEAYQHAEPWKYFWKLQGFDPTGVESVKSDAINGNNVYYDLNGNRLDAPKKGLNIINGKKVIVK